MDELRRLERERDEAEGAVNWTAKKIADLAAGRNTIEPLLLRIYTESKDKRAALDTAISKHLSGQQEVTRLSR